jgi:hypothetical protein
MLTLFLSACLLSPAYQDPCSAMPSAVEIRGDAELSLAESFASAQVRVEEHVRGVWLDRAERSIQRHRPFWMPAVIAQNAVERWLADLSISQLVIHVDREDRTRVHEFGNSYQTTLWVAEDALAVDGSKGQLRHLLKRVERLTLVKAGVTAGIWVILAIILGWMDRLSRGYMTGRLRAIGVVGGLAMPAVLFLV